MHFKSTKVTYLIFFTLHLCALCHLSYSTASSPAKKVISNAAKKKASKMIQQKFYDSVNANIISAAMLSSAGAFNKYSSSSPTQHRQYHRTSILSPAHTASSSFFRPAMRAVFKEAFAYLASPFFMPIAVGRAMKQPPGLPPQDKLSRRFARFLLREVLLGDKNAQEMDDSFKDKFLEYLTKDRKNILLSMKQFTDSRKTKEIKKATSVSNSEDKSQESLESPKNQI